jgi:quercetin dioxygenase-like cupin family protein
MKIGEDLPELCRPKYEAKLWGFEQIIVNREYCGKILTALPNGFACSFHFHRLKHETFHVIRGQLILQVSTVDESGKRRFKNASHEFVLKTGQTFIVPPFNAHRFWAVDEPAVFVEFSTHDKSDDSYRLVPSGPAPFFSFSHLAERTAYDIPTHLQECRRASDSPNARGSKGRVRSKTRSRKNC